MVLLEGEPALKRKASSREATPRATFSTPIATAASNHSDNSGGSVFLTAQPSVSHSYSSDEPPLEPTPQEAEIPSAPEFSLPGNVSIVSVMRDALAAVNFTEGKHEARFSRVWTHEHCRHLAASFTWHAVCEHFQPGSPAVADRVFSHVATAYAKVLGLAKSADVGDTLAWYLPEALAGAAVTALREAYPESSHEFDAPLKRALFDSFVLATSGFGGVREVDDEDGGASGPGRKHGGALRLPSTSKPFSLMTQPPQRSPRGGALPRVGGASPRGGAAGRDLEKALLASRALEVPVVPMARPSLGTLLDLSPSKAQAELERGLQERADAAELLLSGHVDDGPTLQRSCVVGQLPTLRRERRDVAACSPLVQVGR